MRAVVGLLVVLLTWTVQSADDDSNEQCGVYLAVSSTSTADETKLGLYSAKDLPKGVQVGYPDVAINAFHFKANVALEEEEGDKKSEYLNRIVDFFESFIWVPEAAGAKFEVEKGRTVTAVPGAGVLGAFNPRLTNTAWNQKDSYKRPALGEEKGKPHPGRGAFSPFYNVGLKSTTRIVKGSEIFLDYGENWAEEEKAEEITIEDFEKIDVTIDKMIAFFKKHEAEIDEEAKMEIYHFLVRDVMDAAVGPAKGRKVANLLPPRPDDLYKVKEAGGALAFSAPTVYRRIDWLEEHGFCFDNIKPGASTIPNAGRGAFAVRKIKAGGLVVPVPLVHIPDKSVMDMHEVVATESGDYMRESDKVIGQQLLLNYCYGHKESNMLFFPAGSVAALINHSDKPNAKMVWSTRQLHNKAWFMLKPEQLMEDEYLQHGLFIEIVATRDIKEGEEIFIDYGPEWTAAWKKHTEEWNAKKKKGEISDPWPIRAIDLNEEYRSKPFPLEGELKKNPFPENVALKAFLMVDQTDNSGSQEHPKQWAEPVDGTAFDSDNLFDLVVFDHEKIDDKDLLMPYNYTIRWANNKGKFTFVEDVPHEALVFVDKPETGDQFVENPFRHYIGIPDDIFPKGPWRNAA